MENFPLWLVWLSAGLGLAALELALPGMILIFFSLGCFAAALVAGATTAGLVVQVAVFCGASVVSLVVLRRAFMNWFQGQTEGDESVGYDDSPDGAIAKAVKDFSDSGYGQIRYRGSFWNAMAEQGEAIAAGDTVKIVSWLDDKKTALLVTTKLD